MDVATIFERMETAMRKQGLDKQGGCDSKLAKKRINLERIVVLMASE